MYHTKGVEKIQTHIFCSVFLSENHAVYEKMWKNIVERGRQQITIRHMHIERWIPRATNTHSDHVILIVFPQQQWLHERA